jgi:hypothetical protein
MQPYILVSVVLQTDEIETFNDLNKGAVCKGFSLGLAGIFFLVFALELGSSSKDE